MQPYRTTRPHVGTDCQQCSPTGQGHQQCQNDGCDEIASTQGIRHLSDVEYAVLPENFLPIDGYAVAAVFGCDDCTDGADKFAHFCAHPEPVPAPCPKCNAVGDAPCVKKDGSPRTTQHRVRSDARPAAESCTHAHRPSCAVFTGCECATADEPPTRPRRRMPAADPGPDITGLTIPVNVAQAVLAEAGHPWPSVISARSMFTQDTRPAVGAEVYTFDADGNLARDTHGAPVTANVVVPLQAARG